eukprot:7398807-Pyramimonas_sp.AAC.1
MPLAPRASRDRRWRAQATERAWASCAHPVVARAHALSPRAALWSVIDDTTGRVEAPRAAALGGLPAPGA